MRDGDTITRNTAFALAAQLATAGFTAVLTIFLVRYLGPEDYGVFALALGVASLVFLPSDFGISQSTARFVAEHRGEDDPIARVLADGLKLKLIASGLTCIALIVLAGPISHAYDAPEMVWPMRGVALAMLGQSIMGFYKTAFEALGRVSLTLRLIVPRAPSRPGPASARAAGGRCDRRGLWPRDRLRLRRRGRVRADRARRGPARAISLRRGHAGGRIREIARYAGALLIIDAVFAVITQIDILLIGAILGTTAVGIFQAPAKLVAFLHYPGLALSAGVSPRLSRGGSGPNVGAFQAASGTSSSFRRC